MGNQILLVEDEQSIAQNITEMLRIHRFEPVWAADGTTAVELVKQKPFDLIICDIELPDFDGYEILKKIKNDKVHYHTPFIFLTAYDGEEDKRKGFNEGADDYIVKPFSMKTLLGAIEAQLKKSHQASLFRSEELRSRWLEVLNANFSHEFLTPLNGMMSSVFILETELISPQHENLKDLLQGMHWSMQRMARNIQKLLTYSLLELQRGSLKRNCLKGSFNPGQIVETAITELSQAAPALALPEVAIEETSALTGNEQYFKLIINELLNNLLAYHQGNKRPKIVLNARENGFSLSFINETDKQLAFREKDIAPFKKFHNDTTLSGLGLGLHLVKELSSLMRLCFTISEKDDLVHATIESVDE